MKARKKDAIFLLIGATGYGLIEICWRGHTHWTMMVAGGICFLLFSRIGVRFRRRSLFFRAGLAAGCVTAVEFFFGLVFNLGFGMKIWDYSALPLNILGQVCLLYSVLWGALGLIFVPFAEKLNRILEE